MAKPTKYELATKDLAGALGINVPDEVAKEIAAKVESAALQELPPGAVRDALASTEPDALLAGLSSLHGHILVAEAVQDLADDPNYGATARSWLMAPTHGEVE